MRKTLLIATTILLTTFAVNSQGIDKVWMLGNDATNFPVSAGIGAGPDLTIYKDGLGIHTGTVTNTNMGQVEASAKTLVVGDVTYTYVNRFKLNGAGYPGAAAGQTTPTSGTPAVDYFTPTQRYLSFSVLGNSTITIHAISGSTSGVDRALFITDGTKLIGSIVTPVTSILAEYSVTYTGPATKLYLFGNQAVNLYYMKVTNYDVTTSLKENLEVSGVSFNGQQILNENNLSLEVYNVLGKLVAKSTSSIDTDNFQKGIFIVRSNDSKGILKFIK